MLLRDILTDDYAINILKVMYDDEKNSTLSIKSLIETFNSKNISTSINMLEHFELIIKEQNENGGSLALTNKGNKFIESFDVMKSNLLQKEKAKKVKIKYEIRDDEKKILLELQKLAKEEKNENIPLKMLTKASATKLSALKKSLEELDQLNIVKITEISKESMVSLTEKGQELLKEKILETFF